MTEAESKRHRAIFESAVDFAIIATDREGRVTDWNTGAERILGWSAEEMHGEPIDRFFTPEDRAEDHSGFEMRCALEAGRANDERWHLRRDGSRFWASGEMMPLKGEDGAHLGFLKILRDRTEQRLAAETLHEVQGLNTLILSSSRDCIVVLGLDGHTRFVSPGGIEAMEISDVDAILGLSWLRVWKDADGEAAQAAVAEARAGGTGRFQGFCPTHKGTPKWWDVVISPLPGPDGRPERLVSVGRDITESVHAQERLNLSEAALRLATDAAEVGIWDLDLQTDILTWSDRTKAMFGISPHAPCSMADFYAGLHPDDRQATSEAFASALDPARRATYDVEYRTVGKEDGVIRWVAARGRGLFDADGRCVRALGTAINVSARRAVDERLRESEAKLRELNATLEVRVEERTRELQASDARQRAMFDTTRQLIGVLDLDGVLLDGNRAALAAIGARLSDVVGQVFWETPWFSGTPGMADMVKAAVDAAKGGQDVRTEMVLKLPDGSSRTYDFAMQPVLDASGRVIEIIPEATDITEQRQTEEQLRQAQKMEAVGQLTGGLAHDFNNLLTGITGSLEMMQTRITQGRLGEVDRYVTVAQGAAKRAAALTHRLLAFSRRQTLDPKPVNINRLVTGMEELIRRTMGPAVEIEVVGAAGLWTTLVDPNQLENALLNLCVNARDAMPEGGRLTIETANTWLDGRTGRERELPPGQYLSLCVTDTGTGMTPEVIKRAFDPFFTTKPIGMGTGLGLSMVYGFARQSGGQVRIYSELGRGTTMCLYLPRNHSGENGAEAQAELDEAPRAGQDRTVLVVDDEAMVRMLVAEVLEDLGFAAIEAADGAAGLRVLQSDARIDLLITDVGLPGGMNGRQVADAGRAVRPGLRVLFITGYAENAVVGNGHLEPGMQVLTKPFAMDALASRIKDLIAE